MRSIAVYPIYRVCIELMFSLHRISSSLIRQNRLVDRAFGTHRRRKELSQEHKAETKKNDRRNTHKPEKKHCNIYLLIKTLTVCSTVDVRECYPSMGSSRCSVDFFFSILIFLLSIRSFMLLLLLLCWAINLSPANYVRPIYVCVGCGIVQHAVFLSCDWRPIGRLTCIMWLIGQQARAIWSRVYDFTSIIAADVAFRNFLFFSKYSWSQSELCSSIHDSRMFLLLFFSLLIVNHCIAVDFNRQKKKSVGW